MDSRDSISYKVFELLFKEYREKLEKLASFYIHSSEDAKDIVNQSFLSLWEHRDAVIQDQILPYLFTIVKNACLDYRRKNTTHRRVYEQILHQEKAMMDIYTSTIESRDPVALFTNEILSIYKETLLSLPPEQRETWLRSRLEGLTYKEIAKTLGISTKRVDKNMQKVAERLKQALSDYLSLMLFLSSLSITL